MIDELRSWALKYFKDFQVFESETQLPNRQVSKDNHQEYYYRDFDIQAKVINFDLIQNSEPQMAKIMIQDLSGMKFESKLDVKKFEALKSKGQNIRIRAVKVDIDSNRFDSAGTVIPSTSNYQKDLIYIDKRRMNSLDKLK